MQERARREARAAAVLGTRGRRTSSEVADGRGGVGRFGDSAGWGGLGIRQNSAWGAAMSAHHPMATPEGTSTIRIVASREHERIQRPSADQSKSLIVLVWPRSTRTTRPTTVSRMRMAWSSQLAARSVESRCWRSAAIGAPASSVCIRLRSSGFQARTCHRTGVAR